MADTLGEPLQAVGSEDYWHTVTDAKQRKRIQDRLAQRARRHRLREAKNKINQTADEFEVQTQVAHMSQIHHTQCQNPMQQNNHFDFFSELLDMDPFSGNLTSSESASQSLSLSPSLTGQNPVISFELPTPLTVISALFINGQILGLPCMMTVPSKSLPASPLVPLPLHPTPSQLLNIHYHGIDLFPFPKMRENFIIMSAIIDQEDFCHDIFTGPSFTITPGAASWDPRAWKIEKSFEDKWGFLFY